MAKGINELSVITQCKNKDGQDIKALKTFPFIINIQYVPNLR